MNYPLLLTFEGTTKTPQFAATVQMRGRLLASLEVEGVWLYGVNPGAIAQAGDNIADAREKLNETMRGVLTDIANESSSFDDFKVKIEDFFNQSDAHTIAEWEAAREVVRAAKLELPGLKKASSSEISVTVTLAMPADKPHDSITLKAA
jgi:hypothetical protein